MRLVPAALPALLAATLLAAPAAGAAEKLTRKEQLAVELSRLALPEANYDQMIGNVGEQMRAGIDQAMRASGEKVPERIQKVVAEEMDGIVKAVMFTYQEMVDLQAGLLAKHYGEAELEQLVLFYRSPIGQKAIQVMPAVMADAMAAGQAKAQREMPAKLEVLQARIKAEMEAMQAEAGAGGKPAPAAVPAAAPAAKPRKR